MFSEFSGVMDVPDLHQKALRAEKNFESTKIASVDPSVSERSGLYNSRHEVIKGSGLTGHDTGLLDKLLLMFQRNVLPCSSRVQWSILYGPLSPLI
jgi:hypothetical protein